LASVWTDLASKDPDQADAAWQKLGAAGESAIPFVRERIRHIAVPAIDKKLLEKLITDLNSEKFVARDKAILDLQSFGEMAIVPLQCLLEMPPSLEAANRAKIVLKKIGEPVLTADRFRVLEAIDLLEQLSGTQATVLLREIERDALVNQIQKEARQALQRMVPKKETMSPNVFASLWLN